jgi:hypothetical protein
MPEASWPIARLVLGGCSAGASEPAAAKVPAYLIRLDDHVWNEREGSGVRE